MNLARHFRASKTGEGCRPTSLIVRPLTVGFVPSCAIKLGLYGLPTKTRCHSSHRNVDSPQKGLPADFHFSVKCICSEWQANFFVSPMPKVFGLALSVSSVCLQ